jgi:hypothetical protein
VGGGCPEVIWWRMRSELGGGKAVIRGLWVEVIWWGGGGRCGVRLFG